jgi:hypothetical protein
MSGSELFWIVSWQGPLTLSRSKADTTFVLLRFDRDSASSLFCRMNRIEIEEARDLLPN